MNPLEKVVAFAKDKPIVAAGIGGVVLAVGAAAFMPRKKSATPAGEYVVPNVLTPGQAGFGGTTIPGTGTPPATTLPPWLTQPNPQPPNSVPPESPTSTAPRPDSPAAQQALSLFAAPQADIIGTKVLTSQVVNPYGSAYRLSQEHLYYTPSASDYATEVGGGITRITAAKSATAALKGQTYTIDNTTLGTGKAVPVSQRIAGERYDSLGRVIL